MYIATIIVSAVFALLLVASAIGKLRRDPSQIAVLEKVGAIRFAPVLAALEIAAALGLVAGLFWWPIGVAAGAGAALYFLGATIAHLRVGDKAIAMPIVLFIVAIASIVLRLLSA